MGTLYQLSYIAITKNTMLVSQFIKQMRLVAGRSQRIIVMECLNIQL